MRTQRGNIDIDQIRQESIHGGLNAPQIQGFGGGATVEGGIAVFDANGCVIYNGSMSGGGGGGTHAEILTDGLGNPILASGDFIYVLSVPN